MTWVVLVTGANLGIAQQLALRGDAVVLTARDLDKAERAAAGRPGRERMPARRLCHRPGQHPAGRRRPRPPRRPAGRPGQQRRHPCGTWRRASTADLQVVRQALEVTLLGAWQASLTLLPLLGASGHGRIVNVSSEAGSLASMDGGPPACTSPRRP